MPYDDSRNRVKVVEIQSYKAKGGNNNANSIHRGSTLDRNTDRQLAGMEFDKKFIEKVSGKSKDLPQLQSMLGMIREDDEIHVHELSRTFASLSLLTMGCSDSNNNAPSDHDVSRDPCAAWMNRSDTPDERAKALVSAMTLEPALCENGSGDLEPLYVIEDLGRPRVVVLVPRAPTAFAGLVKLVQRERIHYLDVTLEEFSLSLTYLGKGMSELLPEEHGIPDKV